MLLLLSAIAVLPGQLAEYANDWQLCFERPNPLGVGRAIIWMPVSPDLKGATTGAAAEQIPAEDIDASPYGTLLFLAVCLIK